MSTIKDVARLAGVSASTVSRALSNRVFVEEETRQRVLKAVEVLNYKPSLMAKGLREGRSYTIALLVPDINSLFYPTVMKCVERYAAQSGYSIILCNSNEDIECERKNLEMLASRGIDGVLCMSVEDDIRHILAFERDHKIPVVLVNRDFPADISCIAVDNAYGGYLMTKYLLDQGHRRIAGMFGDIGRQRFRERCTGCKRALEEYGVEESKRFFVYNVSSIEEAFGHTMELLGRADRPTAFFASMDVLAIGIYSGLSHSGLRIPEDVSVAGFDNLFMTQYMTPPLTTYNEPVERLSKRAVECLVNRIENRGPVEREILRGELVVRGSVKDVR